MSDGNCGPVAAVCSAVDALREGVSPFDLSREQRLALASAGAFLSSIVAESEYWAFKRVVPSEAAEVTDAVVS